MLRAERSFSGYSSERVFRATEKEERCDSPEVEREERENALKAFRSGEATETLDEQVHCGSMKMEGRSFVTAFLGNGL